MKIRTFEKKDTEAVIEIWESCGLLHAPNDPRQEIKNKSTFQPDLFLVGEINKNVIATIMLGYEGRRGWINALAVLPEYQNRGYGSMLVRHGVEILRNLGAPKINLLVRPSNKRVQDFYKRLGFVNEEVILMTHRFIQEK